jgi:hypothetical protein
VAQTFAEGKRGKLNALVTKRVEEIRNPELLIKVNYKGKKISIPIQSVGTEPLSELITPHIAKFEKEVLSKVDAMQKARGSTRAASKGGRRSILPISFRITTSKQGSPLNA